MLWTSCFTPWCFQRSSWRGANTTGQLDFGEPVPSSFSCWGSFCEGGRYLPEPVLWPRFLLHQHHHVQVGQGVLCVRWCWFTWQLDSDWNCWNYLKFVSDWNCWNYLKFVSDWNCWNYLKFVSDWNCWNYLKFVSDWNCWNYLKFVSDWLKIWNRMTASALKQDPNTKMLNEMLIYVRVTINKRSFEPFCVWVWLNVWCLRASGNCTHAHWQALDLLWFQSGPELTFIMIEIHLMMHYKM